MTTDTLPNMQVFNWGSPMPDGFIRFSHDEDPLGGKPLQRPDFEILSHVHDGVPQAGAAPKMQRHPIESRLLKENGGGANHVRLSEIPVRLLGRNVETNLSARFECFDVATGRMVCLGNGEAALRVATEWEAIAVGGQGGQPASVPCEGPQRCQFAHNTAVSCRFRVRLKLQIDTDGHAAADSTRSGQEGRAAMDADQGQSDIEGAIESQNGHENRELGGQAASVAVPVAASTSASGPSPDPLALFEFQSGGINTYRALLGRITMLYALYGDLRGLPLRLTSWSKSSMHSDYRVFHCASITLRQGLTLKEAGLHAAQHRAEFNTDALDAVLETYRSAALLAPAVGFPVVAPQRQPIPEFHTESAGCSVVNNAVAVAIALEPLSRAVQASMERAAQGEPVKQCSEAALAATVSPPASLPAREIPTASTNPPQEDDMSLPAFFL